MAEISEQRQYGRNICTAKVSPHFRLKQNGSETEAKLFSLFREKNFCFALFRFKRNRIFCMRNETNQSEKIPKRNEPKQKNTEKFFEASSGLKRTGSTTLMVDGDW